MTAKRLTSTRTRALVRRAIAAAELSATSDADFVQMLRASYFTQHPDVEHGFRAASDRAADVEPEQSIYEDPRFARNMRTLARAKKDDLRIIGGEDVKTGDFPDCVAVGNDDRWCCTGTLIAPTVVLSAGHCAKCATRVYFGTDVRRRGKVIRAKATVHPQYKKSANNDLLVLVLEEAATTKPRKIASAAAINAAKAGRAVGFGHIDVHGSYGYGIKRQVDVPVGSPGCNGKVNGRTDAEAYGCDVNLEIVAAKASLTMDSCKGDSGGPFYIRLGSAWLLAGATSRATRGAKRTCGDGGIYVRVDKYRDWIEDATGVSLS